MKLFTLYKRTASGAQVPVAQLPSHRDRPWHFRFEFRGVIYKRALETADRDEAQRRARLKYNEIKDAVIRGEYERLDATKTRHAVHAGLGELFAAYRASPVAASAKTREANIRATLNLLSHVHAQPHDALLQTPFPKLITGDTAEAWFKLDLPGLRAQSMNSLWRFAASLCTTPGAVHTYTKLKMLHPCLADFSRTGLVCQRTVSKAPPRPPADDVLARTLADWAAGEERNLFLAIGLELSFGLRAGEVAQARASWLTVKYGSPMLCASGSFKHNHEGYFELPALDPYYTILRTKALARGWLSAPQGGASVPASLDDYLITGSDSYRKDGIQRDVSAFLRGHGWETTKTNHALRAFVGGQVCLKFGVYRAKEFLRHSSVKVTEQHYLYLMKHPLLDVIRDACPAKWAAINNPITP